MFSRCTEDQANRPNQRKKRLTHGLHKSNITGVR